MFLTCLFATFCFLSLFFYSFYFFFLFCVLSVTFLVFSPYYFSYSLSSLVFQDDLSLFISLMLLVVLFCSSFWAVRFTNMSLLFFLLFSMSLVCYLVFSSSSLFTVYVMYELSLIPIILIIIVWGSYPERSLSSLMLLIYTSAFTIPLMFVLFSVFHSFGTVHFIHFDSSLPPAFSLLLFCAFAVKLPIYGLHFWLPIAHVEAPTTGSIILAGILLKLGGVGLVRSYHLLDLSDIFSVSLSYFFIFLVYVTIVCSFQSDFNRLVAYSSVSHMIVVPILLISFSLVGYNGIVLVLLFHGFSSPLLFSLVGYSYSIFNSRQLVSIRGLLLCSPSLSLLFIMAFMFSLCVPPFPSYVSEVMFFISSINLWSMAPVILVLFSFLSLIYNLNWLSSCLFSISASNLNFSSIHFSYCCFYPIVMLVAVGMTYIFLFSFI